MTEIFLYIANEDIGIATKFVEDLHDKLLWIAKVDFTGAPRDWISSGLRALPYRKRCIYYRVVDDEVHILRVLHQRQDVTEQEFDDNG